MTASTIPISYWHLLREQAEAKGCDFSPIFQELGVDGRALQQATQISAFLYGQLYQRVIHACQDEWFGMFSGGPVPLGAFRLMSLTLLQCSDLRQAISRAGEFCEVCRGMHVRYTLELQEDQALVKIGPVRSVSNTDFVRLQQDANPNHILTSMFAWHRFSCWLVGKSLPIRHLSVSFGEGSTLQPLTDFHPESIQYNQPFNGMAYHPECLDYPVIQNQDALMEFLRTAPYQLVTENRAQISLKEKVRSLLNRDVSSAMPSAEDVAKICNMSVTTLRRRLQAENSSYQALKDECRREAAYHYLNCLDLPNAIVAEKLGFDEPSAFFRAFKKWTGQTPGEYRRQLLAARN
jgi:AraC-like DNA-binding protein